MTFLPAPGVTPPTEHSPKRILSAPHLERYLDYRSEMAALAGKLAALLAQSRSDPGVVDAAGDVEALTASLTRNVWQKITLIARIEPCAALTLQDIGETSALATHPS